MIARRGLIGLALLSSLPQAAKAGAQIEEPLADSVRSALSAAIANAAPPKPMFSNTAARSLYSRWLDAMSQRLKYHKTEPAARVEFLQAVWYESKRAGLDPSLVLGLVQIESGFRKYAISPVGARGYMQVMPFWARLLGNGDASRLFHMQTNLRFGCVILRHYLDIEHGNLFMALGRYNGSRGRTGYPDTVLAARRGWELPKR
jgi:soluble lytic murein transglycosylase-like protein